MSAVPVGHLERHLVDQVMRVGRLRDLAGGDYRDYIVIVARRETLRGDHQTGGTGTLRARRTAALRAGRDTWRNGAHRGSQAGGMEIVSPQPRMFANAARLTATVLPFTAPPQEGTMLELARSMLLPQAGGYGWL